VTKRIRQTAAGVLACISVLLLGASLFAPAPYDKQFREEPNAGCSRQFPLGTDELGRDRLSRLLYGARISLLLAPAAALLATATAALTGGAAGWVGGWLDRGLMSCGDLVLSVPWMFLLLTVRAALPLDVDPWVSLAVTVLLLGGLGWVPAARAIRAGMQALAKSDYLLLARATGCGGWRLFFIHALPNVKGLLVTQFWTTIPVFLLAEANLSLLGLGVTEPVPSLGNLMRELESFHQVKSHPVVLAPLLLLVLVVTCSHLVFEQSREEGSR
jgi:peptide/nickel transport system permease protein